MCIYVCVCECESVYMYEYMKIKHAIKQYRPIDLRLE